MDVSFPSNPEDPGFREAQDDLAEVLERRNPIFSYVARRMVTEKPWTNGSGTMGKREVSRRQVLAATLGAAGVAGLAGCSDGTESDGTATATPEVEE